MWSYFPSPGDPAPDFAARTGGHPALPLGAVAGRYVVLSLLGSLRMPAVRQAAAHMLGRHRAWFDDREACFFGVSVAPADEQDGALADAMPGIRFFRDFDRAVSRLYGVIDGEGEKFRYRPMTLVLDPMLRIIEAISIDPEGQHNARFDRLVATLPPLAEQQFTAAAAPVLELRRVFEPEFCRHLIACYEAAGGHASGFMEDVNGMTTEVLDDRQKRRRDFHVADPDLQAQLRARLERRLVPAIRQAFQFQVSRSERYLIACYDGQDGGFFSRHRDDVMPGTAHRRFAVTLNLNGDYEGGDLVFPEFGLRNYRAPVGGALAFSCALLHEVQPVRRGKRYAFLPFFHDEAAEQIRLRNEKFLSDGVIDRNAARP